MSKKTKKPIVKKNAASHVQIKNKQEISAIAKLVAIGALLLITVVIYSNGMRGALLNFDDVEYFNNYPEVLKLTWHNVITYFSGYYVIMYQPLPILSFAINYAQSGLDTFPMHLVNLIFHLLNIILVYSLIRKISDRFDVAIIVAALFALHPLNVEAVTWISARSSSMYTFFYLLALMFYVDYLKKGLKWKYLVLVLVFFILSLFSKAQAVTLPVVLLAFDYYFKRKLISWRTLLEKVPFFILSLVFGIIAISDKGTMSNITQGMMIDYSTTDTIFLLCYSIVFYFFKLFVPFSLSAVYVYPPKVDDYLPWICYISPAILIIIGVLLFLAARRSRYVLLGVAMFLFTIALNIQIIPSRLFIVTERYVYFPYIGLYFIIGMFYADLANKKIRYSGKIRVWMMGIMILLGISFLYTIYERNKVWKNDIVFMTDILEKNPEVPYLSRAYGNRGNAYTLMNNYQEAIKDFSNAIRVKPDEGQSYFNRGLCYAKIQQDKKAIADFDMAAKYNPNQFFIYSNRAVSKYNLKDYSGTFEDCNIAIKIDSSKFETYNTRAAAAFFLNDLTSAERDFTKSIQLNPTYSDAFKNRGNLYLKQNRLNEACADWNKALELGNSEASGMIKDYCK